MGKHHHAAGAVRVKFNPVASAVNNIAVEIERMKAALKATLPESIELNTALHSLECAKGLALRAVLKLDQYPFEVEHLTPDKQLRFIAV